MYPFEMDNTIKVGLSPEYHLPPFFKITTAPAKQRSVVSIRRPEVESATQKGCVFPSQTY